LDFYCFGLGVPVLAANCGLESAYTAGGFVGLLAVLAANCGLERKE